MPSTTILSSRSFSLPTQRCFHKNLRALHRIYLFSAYAEVFPERKSLVSSGEPFLCLRRGVSRKRKRDKSIAYFSLPTQRCFPNLRTEQVMAELFSAYAEVFPSLTANSSIRAAFLCLRRGVSHRNDLSFVLCCFSLPTQRCFHAASFHPVSAGLFSAYAEVFPCDTSRAERAFSFLEGV